MKAACRLGGCLILLGACSLMWADRPVCEFFLRHPVQEDLRQFLLAASHFGTPYGQGLVLLGIAAATAWKSRELVRIAVGTCAGGLAPNLIKLLVSRIRPKHFDFESQTILDGFTQLFSFGEGGARVQSFPSAHTASAFAFAALLSWRYPSARRFFLLLGAVVAFQRVATLAHFPSDAFVGAAVGWTVGTLFVAWPPLAQHFDRFETAGGQPPLTGGKQATEAEEGTMASSVA